MKKRFSVLAILLVLATTLFIAASCSSAPSAYQGKYYNTNRALVNSSYIDVTSENTCDLYNVYTDLMEDPFGNLGIFLMGKNYTFEILSNGKYLYLQYTDGLAIRADFDGSKKEISHAGYTYKK